MTMWLGDYAEDATIDFKWSTNDADGAAITRATDGTVSVYKANGTTQTTTGVTDTEDFDSLTGIHHCRIATTDAFYATGNDYQVVLSGATVDGQSVVAVLANFSIENRYMRGTDSASTLTAAQVNTEVDTALSDIKLDHLVAVADSDDVVDDSIIAKMASKSGTADWSSFVPGTDSLEAIADSTGSVKTDTTAITAIVAAIVTDTNELQTDWANGGRLDLILDAILADTGTDGVAISATTADQIADALLDRDWTSVSDTNARTVLNALRVLRNKVSESGGTLTVCEEDDSTTAWTAALTTDSGADPITASDPT